MLFHALNMCIFFFFFSYFFVVSFAFTYDTNTSTYSVCMYMQNVARMHTFVIGSGDIY